MDPWTVASFIPQTKMMNLIKKFFANNPPSNFNQEKKTDSNDIQVATCALLLEMANIDGEFSKEEQENILSLLKQKFQLSPDYAEELIQTSRKELNDSADLWQFTNRINQNYSRDKKMQIVEMVWEVIFADGKLDKHEDYLAHKLGKLLRFSHKELIEAKVKILRKGKSD